VGIFFTSRIMDDAILSGRVLLASIRCARGLILEREQPEQGTAVFMALDIESERTTRDVFDYFAADPNDHGFAKTVVPVRMVRQGAENLISRSQARRLLARLDRFSTVILDFSGVESIGRAFADEIFRVFVHVHPTSSFFPSMPTMSSRVIWSIHWSPGGHPNSPTCGHPKLLHLS
jgi:hypothetical protein